MSRTSKLRETPCHIDIFWLSNTSSSTFHLALVILLAPFLMPSQSDGFCSPYFPLILSLSLSFSLSPLPFNFRFMFESVRRLLLHKSSVTRNKIVSLPCIFALWNHLSLINNVSLFFFTTTQPRSRWFVSATLSCIFIILSALNVRESEAQEEEERVFWRFRFIFDWIAINHFLHVKLNERLLFILKLFNIQLSQCR